MSEKKELTVIKSIEDRAAEIQIGITQWQKKRDSQKAFNFSMALQACSSNEQIES